MSCFDNIFSVDGNCSAQSSSVIYDLNQINLDSAFLDSIVGRDFKTGRALATAKLAFAVDIVKNQIVNHFNSGIIQNTLFENRRIGFPEKNLQTKSGVSGQRKGIEIEIRSNTSFVDLYISSIDIWVNSGTDIDLEVWDLIQGRQLETITLSPTAQYIINTQVDKRYESDRRRLHLALLYDSSGVDSYYTTADKNCSSCNGFAPYPQNSYVWTRGVYTTATSNITQEDLTGDGHTAGLGLKYSLQCNHLEWLCSIRNQIALPLLYKTGSLIYDYALHSRRNNSDSLLDREQLQNSKEELEMEYMESIQNVLKSMQLPSNDKCFRCRRTSMTTTGLP